MSTTTNSEALILSQIIHLADQLGATILIGTKKTPHDFFRLTDAHLVVHPPAGKVWNVRTTDEHRGGIWRAIIGNYSELSKVLEWMRGAKLERDLSLTGEWKPEKTSKTISKTRAAKFMNVSKDALADLGPVVTDDGRVTLAAVITLMEQQQSASA